MMMAAGWRVLAVMVVLVAVATRDAGARPRRDRRPRSVSPMYLSSSVGLGDATSVEALAGCTDPAVCRRHHPATTVRRDWGELVRLLRPFDPATKNPCWDVRINGRQQRYCLPYFFLLGMPKCGTTDLHKRLLLHPEVQKACVKEPHWLTRGHMGRWNAKDYLQCFDAKALTKNPTHITMDDSASTFWDRGNTKIPRLANTLVSEALSMILPNAKLLLIMRDPVSRAWSSYRWGHCGRKSGTECSPQGFHRVVTEQIDGMNRCFQQHSMTQCVYQRNWYPYPRLWIGLYIEFFQVWWRHFPATSFFPMRLEWLHEDERGMLSAVFDFLELQQPSEQQWEGILTRKEANVGHILSSEKPLPETVELLKNFYAPFEERLHHAFHARNYSKYAFPSNHQPLDTDDFGSGDDGDIGDGGGRQEPGVGI
eukprot:m.365124 g.365124  ORF g.365124 m.365124 type:complete len:424 (-) comp19971_c0_seq12:125-1396(-)